MTLKDYFKKAKKEKWAIGQFNFSTLEQLKGILAAVKNLNSPVILGTSEGESKYLGLKEILALVEIFKAEYNLPVFLNLDHGKDLSWIKKTIDFGYSAVHFDGSDLTLEKNIKYAKKVVEYGHKKGVLVEGEIEDIKKENLTSTAQAEEFVKKTKIDSLAIAIGNVHGGAAKLNFQRLQEINKKTGVFLVLHGGSGILEKELKKAINLGIVKVNINTDLRIAWKEGLVAGLKGGELKPYKILPKVKKAIQKKVEEKVKIFGSKNKS